MIITSDMLDRLPKCSNLIDGKLPIEHLHDFVANHGGSWEFSFVVDTLKDDGFRFTSRWVNAQHIALLKMSDSFAWGNYRVRNLLTGEYSEHETYANALLAQKADADLYVATKASYFAVNQEIEHDNGDVTWLAVDPETFSEEDRYQVFDHKTGTYTLCETIAEAKERIVQIKNEIVEAGMSPVERCMSCASGDTAWANFDIALENK